MMSLTRRKRRRPDMRRAVILFPSGLTLGNLFFGVFAIVAASRLEFVAAGVYVLLGGICDALDGRVARATNAGTEFGEELDSLVDAITFGLAPGMIMYFAVLNRNGWDWVWAFLFAACAVLRLARFNIEQAGTAKTYFQGLPSPAAGITLASYYWFSQSSLYTYGAIADLKWHVLLRYLMAFLSFLMISNVPYPVFPRTGFRSLRAIGATLLLIGSVALLATRRLEFFFPFALVYVAWGLLRWVFSGLFERRQPTLPYDLSEGEDDEDDDDEEYELTDSRVHATRWTHRHERVVPAERGDRAEREERGERSRGRTEPRGRDGAPDRQKERAPERSTERPSKRNAERTTERAAEKPPRARETERTAKREERKKERPRRPEQPTRDVQAETSPGEPGAPPVTGVDAITLGEPVDATDMNTAESGVQTPAGMTPEGPPGATTPRKRKRRRRRGERKDRPAGGEGASSPSDDGSTAAEEFDGDDDGADNSPYERHDSPTSTALIVPDAAPLSAPVLPPSPPRPEADHSSDDTPPLLPRSTTDSSE